jgi:hypothetical protein
MNADDSSMLSLCNANVNRRLNHTHACPNADSEILLSLCKTVAYIGLNQTQSPNTDEVQQTTNTDSVALLSLCQRGLNPNQWPNDEMTQGHRDLTETTQYVDLVVALQRVAKFFEDWIDTDIRCCLAEVKDPKRKERKKRRTMTETDTQDQKHPTKKRMKLSTCQHPSKCFTYTNEAGCAHSGCQCQLYCSIVCQRRHFSDHKVHCAHSVYAPQKGDSNEGIR